MVYNSDEKVNIRWQNVRSSLFVRNAVMNQQGGWGSVRVVMSGTP